MEGSPEGTTGRMAGRNRAWLVLAAVFVLYLLFRMGQGLIWLFGQM